MTYEYTLADRLKNQFSGRGAALNGMRASSTSELMRRAEMGQNPGVNCAQQAFREQYAHRNSSSVKTARATYDPMNTAVYSTAGVRRAAGVSKQSRGTQQSRGGQSKASAQRRRGNEGRMEPIVPSLELQAKRKFLSPVFVAMLLVSTLMIMLLVMSISEIYETTNEIAGLENEISVLKASEEELELLLEEKNDIRLIEEIATTRLGMTKEDSLQRRYVSLSDGERIDILEVEEEKQESGVLLSALFSTVSGIFGGK